MTTSQPQSLWEQHAVESAVLKALPTTSSPDAHHFGPPYLTAYQLAIKVDAVHPEIAQALGVTVGGRGTGGPTSLAQYLARELSARIKRAGANYPVEGAFVSNEQLTVLAYKDNDGSTVTSSPTGTGYHLSLFRVRT